LEAHLLEFVMVAGVLLIAFWMVNTQRYEFVIVIRSGTAQLRRGKATAAFVDQVAQVCREHNVVRGWVGGIRERRRLKLAFSRSVPRACRQRLRNLWQLT
jgi:hypothetical protein